MGDGEDGERVNTLIICLQLVFENRATGEACCADDGDHHQLSSPEISAQTRASERLYNPSPR